MPAFALVMEWILLLVTGYVVDLVPWHLSSAIWNSSDGSMLVLRCVVKFLFLLRCISLFYG